MQPPAPDSPASTPRQPGPAARLLEWRLPAIETWPGVIAFAQTWVGKLVLFALFAALMKLNARGWWAEENHAWLVLTIAAAAVSLAGRYRHLALLIGAGVLLARDPGWIPYGAVHMTIKQEGLAGLPEISHLRAATLLACVPLAVLVIVLARRYRDHPVGRRPVLAQHILCIALIGLAASHVLRGVPQLVLWSFIAVFAAYFWFLAYALIDQRARQPASLTLQLASFRPFGWPMSVPIGKGAAYLASVEAPDARELAVTQLKGLKLLFWALVLKAVLWLFRTAVYRVVGVPPLAIAFESYLAGTGAPYGLLSIVVNFPEQLLVVALWGHVLVAVARLAGYRILRNTCRPLSSRTIAEFWNRYFYYFKELMAHVYFYPTFVRWFKGHPRLRLAFATCMAAGAGNFFFHLLLQNQTIVQYGPVGAVLHLQAYAFYCAVLSAGIVASQLRTRAPNTNAGWLRSRFLPCLGVAAFYCLLSFFDGPQGHYTLMEHFGFLLLVLGIDR